MLPWVTDVRQFLQESSVSYVGSSPPLPPNVRSTHPHPHYVSGMVGGHYYCCNSGVFFLGYLFRSTFVPGGEIVLVSRTMMEMVNGVIGESFVQKGDPRYIQSKTASALYLLASPLIAVPPVSLLLRSLSAVIPCPHNTRVVFVPGAC